jgi:tetratricopeptide (TPR) repeat protein
MYKIKKPLEAAKDIKADSKAAGATVVALQSSVFVQHNKPEDAIQKRLKAYEAAWKVKPTDQYANLDYAQALRDAKRDVDALSIIEQARKVDGGNVNLLFMEASILADLKRYSEAIAVYKKFLTLKPEDISVLCMLGDLHFRAGQNEYALQAFEKAADINPGDPNIAIMIGLGLHKLGQYEKALKIYDDALVGCSPDSEIYKGITCNRLNLFDDMQRQEGVVATVSAAASAPAYKKS